VSEPPGHLDASITLRREEGDLDRLRTWLRQVRRQAVEGQTTQPFLIVTPLGLPCAGVLAHGLAERSIHVAHKESLPDWPLAATALYVRREDEASLLRALAFEQVWEDLFPHGHAECWLLAGMLDFAELVRCKKELRASLPERRVRLILTGDSHVGRLHPFHVPDLEQLDEEWRCLEVVRSGLVERTIRSQT
jgi:hypothetical protein